MLFPTASDSPRPVRLCEETRKWAWESMHGRYGDEALRNPFVSLDGTEGFESYTDIRKYDAAVRRIAEDAPVRVCGCERICGSATLGAAISCILPAYHGGRPVFPAVSHLTIRYDKVIREGIDSYSRDIAERLKSASSPAEEEFLHSLENVIESMRIWHGRYKEAVKDTRPDLYGLLTRVPFGPAQNFTEAVQALWFTFSFVRLCGNWPGIGRIDVLLGDYLKKDLESGALTLDEAREILASLFIKGCEWIQSDTPVGSGDAQHYQNIVLAGMDENRREVTNEVTYLVLDIVEELAISDFPITVRLRKDSPARLKEKVAAVMKHGGGIVAVYNEELILRALEGLGYPEKDALSFANDGCWEIQVPGKTDFTYMPFDALQIFNEAIGLNKNDGDEPDLRSAEEVYAAFKKLLDETVGNIYRGISGGYKYENGAWHAAGSVIPTSVISLFEDGCIENAKSYWDCGPVYVVRSPHIGGAPDVADSLYAIQKAVFEDHLLTFHELVCALRNNWEGNELLRLKIKNSYVYYGNDSDEVDGWHSRILNDFADTVIKCNDQGKCPVKFIPGVSTFGRQIEWLPNRCATAFGCKKGEILSGNDSPVPGTDTRGATSIIRSYCKSDLVKQSCGAALDVKIFPDSLGGDNGAAALIGLMDGFISLGGFFMQLDTVDAQTLIEAQKDPQKFKTLSVRVSGWNARFVTLNREWQNMIIERTQSRI